MLIQIEFFFPPVMEEKWTRQFNSIREAAEYFDLSYFFLYNCFRKRNYNQFYKYFKIHRMEENKDAKHEKRKMMKRQAAAKIRERKRYQEALIQRQMIKSMMEVDLDKLKWLPTNVMNDEEACLDSKTESSGKKKRSRYEMEVGSSFSRDQENKNSKLKSEHGSTES